VDVPRPLEREWSHTLAVADRVPSRVSAEFRRLGAALHRAQSETGIRTVMIASALPGEGKTLLAGNLGLVLSQAFGRRVLMIDGDLRRPSLHALFGVQNSGGVAGWLESSSDAAPAPTHIAPNLSLLVAGQPKMDPLRIVTGPGMRRLLLETAAQYDWLILDTPPVALLPDAHLLVANVDRVVLVIEAGKTPYDVIRHSIEAVGRERIIGTVLNRSNASRANSQGPGYDAYYSQRTIGV
jgi:capsular exopolysaccharide synthesis family protein